MLDQTVYIYKTYSQYKWLDGDIYSTTQSRKKASSKITRGPIETPLRSTTTRKRTFQKFNLKYLQDQNNKFRKRK